MSCQVFLTYLCHNFFMKSIEDLIDVFVERLKSKMDDKGLKTIKALADKVGIPRTTINSWILKKQLPSMYPLYVLAEYFNVSTDFFFGRTDFE